MSTYTLSTHITQINFSPACSFPHQFIGVASSETFDSEVRISALCSHEVAFVGVSDSVTSTDRSI